MPQASKGVSASPTEAILTGFRKRCNTRLKIDDMEVTESVLGEVWSGLLAVQRVGRQSCGSVIMYSVGLEQTRTFGRCDWGTDTTERIYDRESTNRTAANKSLLEIAQTVVV